MTNKTREKLREEFEKKFKIEYRGSHKMRDVLVYNTILILIWKWIDRAITQSENRILRKWKKAMDYGQSLDRYDYYILMNDEYLKAKGK